MDQKKLDKIYQLYNMNYTYKCIATDGGISAESVRYYVKKGITNNKLKPRGRVNSRKVTRFDETILDLYNNDYTNKEIAENIGMCREYIASRIKYLKDIGKIDMPDQRRRALKTTDPITDKIIAMYNNGITRKKIAAELNVPFESVAHIIRIATNAGKITRKTFNFTNDKYEIHKARYNTAIALHSLGYANKDIAELLGVNIKSISRYIIEWRDSAM